jgi:hypothetical protein
MKTSLKIALATGLTIAGLGFAASSASALPAGGLDPAIATSSDLAQGVQDVRWVCGYWGCHWRPNYYGFYGGYGWHRPYYGGWHRWGGWGWHRHW